MAWIPSYKFTTVTCSECGYTLPTNPIAIRGQAFNPICPRCEKNRLEREKKEFIDKSEGFIKVPEVIPTKAEVSNGTKRHNENPENVDGDRETELSHGNHKATTRTKSTKSTKSSGKTIKQTKTGE